MSDDSFSWVPSANSEVNDTFSVRKAQLGDGYVVQAPDGINPSKETWPLTFENIPRTTGDAIRTFLRNHIGQTFLWTRPDGETIRVRCEEGPRQRFASASTVTVSCTLIQTFNP